MNAFNDKYSDIKKDLISIGKKIGKYFLEKKTGIDIDNFFENSVYSEIKKDKIKLKKTIADKVSKNEDNFPLIIMIDELDRCNPLYAIEFLEVIKHFFEIDKVVFILGIDIKELEHSIKKVYGDNLNTQRYLKKIIDVIYDLPNPKKEKYIDFLQSKYENLHSEFNTNMIYRNILLDNSNNLRDIENFFIRYNLTYKKNNIGKNFNLQITDFIKNYLLLMEIFNNDLYNKIKNKNLKKEYFNKIFIFLGEKTLEYRHEQIDESLLLILKYVYPDKTKKDLINDLKEQKIEISQVLLVRRISQYLKIEPIFSEIELLGGVK